MNLLGCFFFISVTNMDAHIRQAKVSSSPTELRQLCLSPQTLHSSAFVRGSQSKDSLLKGKGAKPVSESG